MVKEVTWFEANDGSQFKTIELAEMHERKILLRRTIRNKIPAATDGLHCNVQQFFIDNIDAIGDIVDAYRSAIK